MGGVVLDLELVVNVAGDIEGGILPLFVMAVGIHQRNVVAVVLVAAHVDAPVVMHGEHLFAVDIHAADLRVQEVRFRRVADAEVFVGEMQGREHALVFFLAADQYAGGGGRLELHFGGIVPGVVGIIVSVPAGAVAVILGHGELGAVHAAALPAVVQEVLRLACRLSHVVRDQVQVSVQALAVRKGTHGDGIADILHGDGIHVVQLIPVRVHGAEEFAPPGDSRIGKTNIARKAIQKIRYRRVVVPDFGSVEIPLAYVHGVQPVRQADAEVGVAGGGIVHVEIDVVVHVQIQLLSLFALQFKGVFHGFGFLGRDLAGAHVRQRGCVAVQLVKDPAVRVRVFVHQIAHAARLADLDAAVMDQVQVVGVHVGVHRAQRTDEPAGLYFALLVFLMQAAHDLHGGGAEFAAADVQRIRARVRPLCEHVRAGIGEELAAVNEGFAALDVDHLVAVVLRLAVAVKDAVPDHKSGVAAHVEAGAPVDLNELFGIGPFINAFSKAHRLRKDGAALFYRGFARLFPRVDLILVGLDLFAAGLLRLFAQAGAQGDQVFGQVERARFSARAAGAAGAARGAAAALGRLFGGGQVIQGVRRRLGARLGRLAPRQMRVVRHPEGDPVEL